MDSVEVGKKYRHFKGHLIEIMAIGKNSESLEDMVVYRHLGTNAVWVRPLTMFLEKEDVSLRKDNITGQKYRFVLVEE